MLKIAVNTTRFTLLMPNLAVFDIACHSMLRYPKQEYSTGRKLRCSPLHTRQEQTGAVFGETVAYERAMYFSLNGVLPVSLLSYTKMCRLHVTGVAFSLCHGLCQCFLSVTPLCQLHVTGVAFSLCHGLCQCFLSVTPVCRLHVTGVVSVCAMAYASVSCLLLHCVGCM